MTITRKDLEAIARAIATAPRSPGGYTHVDDVARLVADELKPLCGLTTNGNSRFDRDRFLKACGLEVPTRTRMVSREASL